MVLSLSVGLAACRPALKPDDTVITTSRAAGRKARQGKRDAKEKKEPARESRPEEPLVVGVFQSPTTAEVEQAIRVFQLNRSIDGPERNQAWAPFFELLFAYLAQPAGRLSLGTLVRARVAAEFELDADRRRGELADEVEEAVRKLLARIDYKIARIRRLQSQRRYSPPPEAENSLCWPLAYGLITSRFGTRRDPIERDRWRFHAGLDRAAAPREPVYAAMAGQVIQAGWNGGFGRMVKIRHAGGLETLYAHLEVILVEEGQFVSKGQIVGLLGKSGRTTGYHLHFAVYRDGKPIDPLDLLPTGNLRFSDMLPGATFGEIE